jgi:hypothetical protein
MKHFTRLYWQFLLFLFLSALFCSAHLFAEGETFRAKTLWHPDYDEWFGHLPAETRVRYPVAFPWKPAPEDVKYIFFMTAGQQALCNSTNSNVTGALAGQQEILYRIGSDAIRKMVATFINDDRYSWLISGIPDEVKHTIANLSGPIGSLLVDFVGGLIGIPGLGPIGGIVSDNAVRIYIFTQLNFEINRIRNEELTFFEDFGSIGKNLYYMENITMPDGSHFNETNTLLVLNMRGLCVTDRDGGDEWEEIDATRAQTIQGYYDMLSSLSNGFENVRLMYFAGHSRGGVQVLRMGKHFHDSGLVPKKTHILVSAIDAVVDPGNGDIPGEAGTLGDIIINPLEDMSKNVLTTINIDFFTPFFPLAVNLTLEEPFHNKVYYAYYSDLPDFIDPAISTHQSLDLGNFNYDGNYFINNLVGGSMLIERG